MSKVKTAVSVAPLALILLISGCSKGGMFGSSLAGFVSGGSGSTDTIQYTAANQSLYSDLELKINKSNNVILKYLNSVMPLNTFGAAETAILNDFDLNFDPNCIDAANDIYSCPIDSNTVASLVLQSNSVSPMSSNIQAVSTSPAPILQGHSPDYSARMALLAKFKAQEAIGVAVDSNNFANLIPECVADQMSTTICSLLTMVVSVNGEPAVYKVYEHLSLRDKNLEEFKDYVKYDLSTSDSYKDVIKVSDAEVTALLKKKARREFLQVNANAILSHGVNIFSLLTWAGYDVSNSQNNSIFQGLNINKQDLTDIYVAEKDNALGQTYLKDKVLNTNKPAFYYFVEKFISEDDMQLVPGTTNHFEYFINIPNLCKYVSSSGLGDGCAQTLTTYFNRIRFIQNLQTKRITVTYKDAPYISTETEAFYFDYTYDYKASLKIDLNNTKTIYAAFLQHELDSAPTTAAENKIDAGDIALLNSATVRGIASINDHIEVPLAAQIENGIADITQTTLASKIGLSLDTDFYVHIPENLDQNVKYDAFSGSNSTVSFNGSSEGDVIMNVPKTDNLVSLAHHRGNTIYDDILGINAPQMDLQFPPYQLSERDLLVFEGAINPKCEESLAGTLGCDNQVRISKVAVNNSMALAYLHGKRYAANGIDFDDYSFGLTPVDLKFFIPVDPTIVDTTQWNRTISSAVTATAFQSAVYYRAYNDTWWGQNISLAYPNYVDGHVDYLINVPNGATFDKSMNVIADSVSGQLPVIALTASLDLVRADNGSMDSFRNCGIPLDFTSSTSISTAVSNVVMQIPNGAYVGQYVCAP